MLISESAGHAPKRFAQLLTLFHMNAVEQQTRELCPLRKPPSPSPQRTQAHILDGVAGQRVAVDVVHGQLVQGERACRKETSEKLMYDDPSHQRLSTVSLFRESVPAETHTHTQGSGSRLNDW